MEPTNKQKQALKLLTNHETESVGYGGAAGGGKTYIGCWWLMQLGFYAPGTRYFIGRDSLKDTRGSVLKSWNKLAKEIGFKAYKFTDNMILFDNGSEIEFLDLSFYPVKDPMYERFGSKEFTAGWIEEAGSVHYMAYQVLLTRIGRWHNEKFNIKKKILSTFNPKKNWVDYTFYRPFSKNEETERVKFVYALPSDNQHLPDDYIPTLLALGDETTKQRLLFGNFDYDDDPSSMVDFEAICDIFTNDHVKKGNKSISADLAMQGRDKFIAGYWEGLRCSIEIDQKKSTGKSIEIDLKELKTVKAVGNSRIVADSDGLGNYLESYIKNIVSFRGGAGAKNKKEYANIKSECGFLLAKKITAREIYVKCTKDQEEALKRELSTCLKRDSLYKDERKKKLIPKDKMKESLGHSPDYMDMLLMGMYLHIKKRKGIK